MSFLVSEQSAGGVLVVKQNWGGDIKVIYTAQTVGLKSKDSHRYKRNREGVGGWSKR